MTGKIASALVIGFLVSSCAAEPVGDTGELYSSYREYRDTVSRENLWSRYTDFFSGSLVKPELRNDPQIEDQLLFSAYMQQEAGHLETLSADMGCLIVTGRDSAGQPLAFEVSYVDERGTWLMSRIVVHVVDTVEELPRQANCLN